jgi:hypothetical protein
MPIPLYGFMEGDTVGLLIFADEADTIHTLAQKLQDAARIRVASKGRVQVVYNDIAIDPALTIEQAGLQPLDRFDVISDS